MVSHNRQNILDEQTAAQPEICVLPRPYLKEKVSEFIRFLIIIHKATKLYGLQSKKSTQ
jgi:hypothetical protein